MTYKAELGDSQVFKFGRSCRNVVKPGSRLNNSCAQADSIAFERGIKHVHSERLCPCKRGKRKAGDFWSASNV